jgi:formylglycine-generating enzyme required for sulfatase activity
MSGNVLEWCLNEYDKPQNVALAGEARRVLRGGAWIHYQNYVRATSRQPLPPYDRSNYLIGFRLACSSLF